MHYIISKVEHYIGNKNGIWDTHTGRLKHCGGKAMNPIQSSNPCVDEGKETRGNEAVSTTGKEKKKDVTKPLIQTEGK